MKSLEATEAQSFITNKFRVEIKFKQNVTD